jgi:hypothetical protein
VRRLGVQKLAAAAGGVVQAGWTHLNHQAATLGIRLLQPEAQRLVHLHLNMQCGVSGRCAGASSPAVPEPHMLLGCLPMWRQAALLL